MIDAFIDFVNAIYWDGYAEQLAENDPAKYTFELNEFLNNY